MRRMSNSKAAALKAAKKGGTPKREATRSEEPPADDADADQRDETEVKPEIVGDSKDGGTRERDGSDSEVETFEVESILGSRVRHGKQQFRIRWKGYGPADDTWEDEENVDSPDLIAAFLKGSPEDTKAKKKGESPKKKGAKRMAVPKEKTSAKKPKRDNGSDEWEVSKIIDDVELKDGTRQFLVRWKGFSSKENTWEPEANLNCPELIKKYLEQLEHQEKATRETRTDRRQVNRYMPHLSKRKSHRSSAVLSGGDGSFDDPIDTTSYSYHQRGVSSYKRSPIHNSHIPSCPSKRVYKLNSSTISINNSSWHSRLSSKCTVM